MWIGSLFGYFNYTGLAMHAPCSMKPRVQIRFVEISVKMGSDMCSSANTLDKLWCRLEKRLKVGVEIAHNLQLSSLPLAWHMLLDKALGASQDHALCQETRGPEAVKLIARGGQEDVSWMTAKTAGRPAHSGHTLRVQTFPCALIIFVKLPAEWRLWRGQVIQG